VFQDYQKLASASDFITSGKEYNEFKKLVNAVKSLAPQKLNVEQYLQLSNRWGPILETCATAIHRQTQLEQQLN
jgi:hypothetical protein